MPFYSCHLCGIFFAYVQVNNKINPSPYNKECYLYAVDSQASVVFVAIQYAVPPENATLWTKEVFQVMQPSRHTFVPCTYLFITVNECLLHHSLALGTARLVHACYHCLHNHTALTAGSSFSHPETSTKTDVSGCTLVPGF